MVSAKVIGLSRLVRYLDKYLPIDLSKNNIQKDIKNINLSKANWDGFRDLTEDIFDNISPHQNFATSAARLPGRRNDLIRVSPSDPKYSS